MESLRTIISNFMKQSNISYQNKYGSQYYSSVRNCATNALKSNFEMIVSFNLLLKHLYLLYLCVYAYNI